MVRRRKAVDAPARASANPPQNIPAGPVRADFKAMMPGHRMRHDGWNQARLQRFLDVLAHCGCVQDACRVAGMSAAGARRLKARYPLFSAAWDEALARAGQGLITIAYNRAIAGRETVIYRQGAEFERRIQPSDAILSLLIKRGDLLGGGGVHRDDLLSFDEWQRHIRFDCSGKKFQGRDPRVEAEEFAEKMIRLRQRLIEKANAGHACPTCGQKLPVKQYNHSVAELVALGVVGPDDL